jgi:pimeloyl-ACP methyl ester carboxylesterase
LAGGSSRSGNHDFSWQRTELALDGGGVAVLERVGVDSPSEETLAKPPIVVIHGIVAEADSYRKLIAALPSDRRVLALDLPGAGYAPRPCVGCSTFEELADFVAEAVLRLGLERPVLVGHSHGGAISLTLAARQPELVSGLVLLSAAHPYSGKEHNVVRFYLSRPGRWFAHMLPRLPDRVMLFGFRRMPGERSTLQMEDIVPYLHSLRVPGTVDHILRMVASWEADMTKLRARLDASPLSLPTLLVWGANDIVVPAKTADALTERLAEWEMVTLPGIGHLPNDEAPETTAALMSDWLRRCGL